MQRHRRTWVLVAGLSLFAMLLVGAMSAYGLQAHAATNPQDGRPDQDVVEAYFHILNAGMQTGDFAALATVYGPDATLTQSNPKGVTIVAHGLTEITAWYVHVLYVKYAGITFTQDSMRSLAPHVVLSYEHAGTPTWIKPARCMHVFTLREGWIETLDWATFYGGVPA